jgi:O-antigen ligase
MTAVSVLMTFSRGAFLGMATVALLYLLSRRRFSTIVVVAVVLAASFLLLPGAVRDRAMMGIEGGNVDVISAGRTDGIWMPLLGYAVESPIIGHGLAATLWSEPMRKDPSFHVGHAHSAYINTFLDMGLVGLILLPGFFVLQISEFRRLSTDNSVSPLLRGIFKGAAAGVVVYFIQGMTDDRFTPTASQITLWFLIGLSFGKSSELLRPVLQRGASWQPTR